MQGLNTRSKSQAPPKVCDKASRGWLAEGNSGRSARFHRRKHINILCFGGALETRGNSTDTKHRAESACTKYGYSPSCSTRTRLQSSRLCGPLVDGARIEPIDIWYIVRAMTSHTYFSVLIIRENELTILYLRKVTLAQRLPHFDGIRAWAHTSPHSCLPSKRW